MGLKVNLVFRKKNPRFFSIENVFERVVKSSQTLPIWFEKIVLPNFGISIWNLFYLNRKKMRSGELFHVTGDAHYAVFVLPRERTILTIHDCVFLDQSSGFKRMLIKKLLLDWPVGWAKQITTISVKTKHEIVAYTGCDESKVKVIPNPISNEIQFLNRPFNEACPSILFVGVTPNKNLERVIEALIDIPCILIIIGRLSEGQESMLHANSIRYIQKYGLSEEEIAYEYSSSSMVLFPSLYEGFGLPIIEGFKAGRVVVTSDRSPMKDVAQGAACLVDPEDIRSIREGVLKVITDKVYRELLVSKGFEVVKQFEPDVIAQQYYELYKKVYLESCAG